MLLNLFTYAAKKRFAYSEWVQNYSYFLLRNHYYASVVERIIQAHCETVNETHVKNQVNDTTNVNII